MSRRIQSGIPFSEYDAEKGNLDNREIRSADHINISEGNEIDGFTSLASKISKDQSPPKYLSVIAAATLIATWNTTSTLMNFPNIFGQLGSAGGPVFTLGFQGLTYIIALFQIRMISYYKSLGHTVNTFADLGYCLCGHTGRKIFLTMQMMNQIGFLPYALDLTSSSIQRIFYGSSFLSCNGNTMVIVILCCYVLVQLSRDWKNFHGLAYLVFLLTIVQAGLLSSNVYSNPDWVFGPNKTLVFFGENFEIGANCSLPPDNVTPCQTPSEFFTFDTFWEAIGSIVFSFAPCFIVTELMSEMQNPEKEMKIAVSIAFTFSSLLNEYMGLVFVLIWGNQIPMGVEQLLPLGTGVDITAQLIIILAMILDFVISVLVINRQVVLWYKPDFDFAWTRENAVVWATATFVPMTLTFMIALFIPNLESLITFVDAVCIPYVNFVLVPLFSFHFLSSRGVCEDPLPISTPRKILLGFSAFLGIIVSGIKFYQFIVNLTELSFGGNYWCDSIGGS